MEHDQFITKKLVWIPGWIHSSDSEKNPSGVPKFLHPLVTYWVRMRIHLTPILPQELGRRMLNLWERLITTNFRQKYSTYPGA